MTGEVEKEQGSVMLRNQHWCRLRGRLLAETVRNCLFLSFYFVNQKWAIMASAYGSTELE